MKKLISLLLALMMIAGAAAVAVSAEILYEDDFEGPDFNFYDHNTGEGFWFLNPVNGGSGMGKFEQSNGCMNGWEDAQFGFSMYWGGELDDTFADRYPCVKEMTTWFDVKLDEGGISDRYCFGLEFADPYDVSRGYTASKDMYYAAFYAIDETDAQNKQYGFARLTYSTPRKDKKLNVYSQDVSGDYILGEYNVEEINGYNLDGEAARIGVRFGNGNITMYVNGKIVGSYDRETIGMLTTPAAWFHNQNCYVEVDNYVLATYDHDVKKATRLDSYELYEGKVTVVDGAGAVVGTIDAAEDDELEITAPAVSGKTFVKWDSVAIDGKVVSDFEKAELLYGIELGDLNAEKFAMTMPDAEVTLTATYEAGGSSSVIPGDANGDGKLNSRDVILVMKAALPGFGGTIVMEAADLNHDGKLNSRDVILVMKEMLK